ncbi:MAG: JAB domain-containing protein, partial [Clostridium sp.]|nr:JAB domain-containing protein [Clostridium sp.]
IVKNRNVEKTSLAKFSDACDYCKNLFYNQTKELVYMVTINNKREVIGDYKIGSGTVNSTNVDMKRVVTLVTKDNAASVLLTHNHPDGTAAPSANDVNFTIKFRYTLDSLGVSLYDHIVVGSDDCHSMKMKKDFCFES